MTYEREQYDTLSAILISLLYRLELLSLKLVTDFIIFGGYIILTCAVNGISTVDRDVTRQWSMGNEDQLLSYNGRINNHRKYEETIIPGNEFSLKISNVTEKDVNVTYRCRYGFDAVNIFIELNEYNYVNPPTPESTTITYFLEKEMDTINISVYFKRVFPLPNCSVNIDATNFDITDLREHEVDMDVNLSLSLQRRVACSRSLNISCHVARKQYDVGYLKLKDECSFKDKFDAMIILLITLITIGILILILVLVITKRRVSDVRKYQKKDTTCTKDQNQIDNKTESEKNMVLSKAEDSLNRYKEVAECHTRYCKNNLNTEKWTTRGHVIMTRMKSEFTHTFLWSSSPYMQNKEYLVNNRVQHGLICSGLLQSHYTKFIDMKELGKLIRKNEINSSTHMKTTSKQNTTSLQQQPSLENQLPTRMTNLRGNRCSN
ncbi:unnamed protein product [Mytilus coruscus]|uniref:Ig-like domain-containing protein n=1 Tax=Mytilus coruscus TaxID=42192 RepID=A0A6J8EKS9_MYTCO|nr:unnamed protein product [Mytilus coruscus]